jgi:hypothetical protein
VALKNTGTSGNIEYKNDLLTNASPSGDLTIAASHAAGNTSGTITITENTGNVIVDSINSVVGIVAHGGGITVKAAQDITVNEQVSTASTGTITFNANGTITPNNTPPLIKAKTVYIFPQDPAMKHIGIDDAGISGSTTVIPKETLRTMDSMVTDVIIGDSSFVGNFYIGQGVGGSHAEPIGFPAALPYNLTIQSNSSASNTMFFRFPDPANSLNLAFDKTLTIDTNAAITRSNDNAANDIAAETLILTANSVGTSLFPLLTSVDYLGSSSGTVTVSNDLYLTNNNKNLTIAGVVEAGADLEIKVADTTGLDQPVDLTINKTITSTAGNIVLEAAGKVTQDTSTKITATAGTGSLTVTAKSGITLESTAGNSVPSVSLENGPTAGNIAYTNNRSGGLDVTKADNTFSGGTVTITEEQADIKVSGGITTIGGAVTLTTKNAAGKISLAVSGTVINTAVTDPVSGGGRFRWTAS